MINKSMEEKRNYQRFLAGQLCNRLDKELLDIIIKTKEALLIINDIKTPVKERENVLSNMFGGIGKYSRIGSNFTCQCGKHIFIGDKSVINDNCTMMDENHIYIGNQVVIAPNVQFYTATHPINYSERFIEN